MQATKNKHSLPLPRLEFNWRKNGETWANRFCDYFLVLPIDKLDIRSNSEDEIGVYDEWRVFIGQTRVSGNARKPVFDDGVVETPFRDFTHMKRDNLVLGGLPKYAVCEDSVTELTQE